MSSITAASERTIAVEALGREEAFERNRRERSWKIIPTVGLLLLGLLFALPFLWLVLAAFSRNASAELAWPNWSLRNFREATAPIYVGSLGWSLELGLVAMVVATVPAIPAGYALARRQLPLKDGLMVVILFLTSVPIAIVVIPMYAVLSREGLLGPLVSGVFVGVTNVPFALWLVRAAVQSIPLPLEEAAVMERARLRQILVHITIPLALPGIVAAGFFAFAAGWSAFLVPLVLSNGTGQVPAALALYGFIHSGSLIQYGPLSAFSVLYSVPVVLLYVLLSRFAKGGFAFAGGVRG